MPSFDTFVVGLTRQGVGNICRIAGDNILSEKNYVNIIGFHSFVKREQLTDDEITTLLMCNANEFPFLNDLVSRVTDCVEELRDHGPMSVAMMYRQRKLIDEKLNKIISREEELSPNQK